MPELTYTELVRRLFPRLTGGIRWGLERTAELLDHAGQPHRKFDSIHVGGTNGKGSVAATLANVLTRTGLRTGLYCSPHLCSFRERIRIDGVPIDEQALLAAAAPLWPAIEQSGASFFEATTVLAFAALARAEVDLAVVEVGLGGRLDATNVIMPRLAIITNIAFDHADYLGDSIAAIAGEKAGIIKPGVPLLTAETSTEVLHIFEQRAAQVGASISRLASVEELATDLQGSSFRINTAHWGALELSTPLIGEHQVRNAALAVSAADMLAETFRIEQVALVAGVAGVRWPGRIQVEQLRGGTWIFDVAHNEAGVKALVQTLQSLDLPRPRALLVGILGDKDWARMLPPLFDFADQIVLTVPATAPPGRVWDPHAVLVRVPAARAQVVPSFARAVEVVSANAAGGGTVLITGSFHTVGEAQALLGLCEVAPDFPLPHNRFSG